jgi:hypothetical protein
MRSLQQATALLSWADGSPTDKANGPQAHIRLAFRRAIIRVTAVLNRRARAEDAIAAGYACHGWCDSMEGQLIDHISNQPFTYR